MREIRSRWAAHVAGIWEELVRASIPRERYFNQSWGEARSWWGPGMDRTPVEVDMVAESTDGTAVLIGEVVWSKDFDRARLEAEVRRKAENLPFVRGRQLVTGVWTPAAASRGGHFGPRVVLQALQ